jgi:hypothetical protein
VEVIGSNPIAPTNKDNKINELPDSVIWFDQPGLYPACMGISGEERRLRGIAAAW